MPETFSFLKSGDNPMFRESHPERESHAERGAIGIAAIWLAFYAVIGIAAVAGSFTSSIATLAAIH